MFRPATLPEPPSGHRLFLLAVAALLLLACGDDESRLADFLSRGDAYFEQEQIKEAIIEYRNAIQVDPNNGAAHYALAKAYLRARNLKEAYWELHETQRIGVIGNDQPVEWPGQFDRLTG